MKITSETDKLNNFEQKINLCIDLLETAKSFCTVNYDKASEINTISTIIEIILAKQKELAIDFDSLLLPNN